MPSFVRNHQSAASPQLKARAATWNPGQAVRPKRDLSGMRVALTGSVTMTLCSSNEFDNLVRAHWANVFRFLLVSVGDEEVAESLTQECFLKAFRNVSNFRGESSVRTWLMRIAFNLKTDFWRSRRMQFWRETQANDMDSILASDDLPSWEISPEARLLAREQEARVWQALGTLGPRERNVVLLRYVEELRLHEVGECTGLKLGTVKTCLQRALTKMREALGDGDRVRRKQAVTRSPRSLRKQSSRPNHRSGNSPSI